MSALEKFLELAPEFRPEIGGQPFVVSFGLKLQFNGQLGNGIEDEGVQFLVLNHLRKHYIPAGE